MGLVHHVVCLFTPHSSAFAGTHFAQTDGQAEWVAVYIAR